MYMCVYVYMCICVYTDKTSLKADREVGGEGEWEWDGGVGWGMLLA